MWKGCVHVILNSGINKKPVYVIAMEFCVCRFGGRGKNILHFETENIDFFFQKEHFWEQLL